MCFLCTVVLFCHPVYVRYMVLSHVRCEKVDGKERKNNNRTITTPLRGSDDRGRASRPCAVLRFRRYTYCGRTGVGNTFLWVATAAVFSQWNSSVYSTAAFDDAPIGYNEERAPLLYTHTAQHTDVLETQVTLPRCFTCQHRKCLI